MMVLETDLERIKALATIHYDDFEVLRYQLQQDDELDDALLDTFIERIAAPISAAIDCTQCANCCGSLDVYLTEADARRLAAGIDIPLDALLDQYIDRKAAVEVEEWGMFGQRPCAFLKGKLCSVYAHRPESCRTYPVFTPDFRWTLEDTIAGAGLCPIIYNVLSTVAAQIHTFYTTPK